LGKAEKYGENRQRAKSGSNSIFVISDKNTFLSFMQKRNVFYQLASQQQIGDKNEYSATKRQGRLQTGERTLE
jgi:hypothetical protein